MDSISMHISIISAVWKLHPSMTLSFWGISGSIQTIQVIKKNVFNVLPNFKEDGRGRKQKFPSLAYL